MSCILFMYLFVSILWELHTYFWNFIFWVYILPFLQLLPGSIPHFPKNPTSCSHSLSLLNKLNPICVAPILLTVGPKRYKPLSFVLNYPLELDRKTRLLKIPHAWRTLKNEMGIDIDRHAIRTSKLSKHWTVLCVLSGEKSKHQTYPAVTLMSYSNGCPGKTHPLVQ